MTTLRQGVHQFVRMRRDLGFKLHAVSDLEETIDHAELRIAVRLGLTVSGAALSAAMYFL